MFSNTGTAAFWLYGIFIVISLVGVIAASSYIIRSSEQDKLSKIADLIKYFVVSIGIATVTLIITNLFKEREQDVKELEYFDKYVQDVKKVDGIQERYQLSKYLSIVAPSGELKKSWQTYYDTLKIEYDEYLHLKSVKQKLDTIVQPTKAQILQKQQVDEKIEQKEAPLVTYQKSVAKDFAAAKEWEAKGFEYLLLKDVENAINAFTESENAYNQYHQAYEISQYLRLHQRDLKNKNDTAWKDAYKKIVQEFYRGMPDDYKTMIRNLYQ